MGFSSIIESIKLKKQEKYIGMTIPWYFIYDASSFSLYDIQFLDFYVFWLLMRRSKNSTPCVNVI